MNKKLVYLLCGGVLLSQMAFGMDQSWEDLEGVGETEEPIEILERSPAEEVQREREERENGPAFNNPSEGEILVRASEDYFRDDFSAIKKFLEKVSSLEELEGDGSTAMVTFGHRDAQRVRRFFEWFKSYRNLNGYNKNCVGVKCETAGEFEKFVLKIANIDKFHEMVKSVLRSEKRIQNFYGILRTVSSYLFAIASVSPKKLEHAVTFSTVAMGAVVISLAVSGATFIKTGCCSFGFVGGLMACGFGGFSCLLGGGLFIAMLELFLRCHGYRGKSDFLYSKNFWRNIHRWQGGANALQQRIETSVRGGTRRFLQECEDGSMRALYGVPLEEPGETRDDEDAPSLVFLLKKGLQVGVAEACRFAEQFGTLLCGINGSEEEKLRTD